MSFAFDEPFYFKRGLNRSHESFFAAWAAVASMQGIAPVSMLRSLGFGRLGPIAGSAAANIQSGIGNVTAGLREPFFNSAERRDGWFWCRDGEEASFQITQA
ncbi:uncharacterized protein CPUR_05267 [Claviceps purpurea 20.1]|uniref:Uncharacterized protein n=1 Tax=Claviceps purpurea (strain 20.1) TaxID=1111077 RepID=M1WG20_CLAP2|nr:uncharacterized protein CPUR_05267 [Claviceps purpurea 20.1]